MYTFPCSQCLPHSFVLPSGCLIHSWAGGISQYKTYALKYVKYSIISFSGGLWHTFSLVLLLRFTEKGTVSELKVPQREGGGWLAECTTTSKGRACLISQIWFILIWVTIPCQNICMCTFSKSLGSEAEIICLWNAFLALFLIAVSVLKTKE